MFENDNLRPLWVFLTAIFFICAFGLAFFYIPRHEANEVNICLHLEDYDGQTVSYLKDLKVKWVRTDWENASEMSVYSQVLQINSINLLAIFDLRTFGYEVPTLQEWNDTLKEIVKSASFKTVDAAEIWNEPNGAAFIPPETYREMLKNAYAIIKNHTEIPVVFAGISPIIEGWQEYLNAVFVNNDIQEYFDYMGIHLYDDMPRNLDTLRFVKGLTSKPIWLTETGKPSIGNGEVAQAEYLSSIYSTIEPLVSKIFLYELKDNYGLLPESENHFGLLTINNAKKYSYQTIFYISKS